MVAIVERNANRSGLWRRVGNRQAHVLVVSDDPDDGDLLIDAFRAEGLGQVERLVGLEACVGRYGAKAAAGAIRRPDLVVIDTMSPDARLTQCLERLKSGGLSSVPIVVLSDLYDQERVDDCYGAHAAAYLVKPTSPDGLRQTARSIASFWLGESELPDGRLPQE